MEIAPAFFPDLRTVRPALAVAREQHLQPFGEARLPGPITTDDDRQARPWSECEGLLRSDAPKALNCQRREVGAGPLLRPDGCRASCGRLCVQQQALNRIAAAACRKNETGPALLQQSFRVEPVVDQASRLRSSFTGSPFGFRLAQLSAIPATPQSLFRRRVLH